MKRSILKILLIIGLPLGGYYLLYGIGLITQMIGLFTTLKAPTVVNGFFGMLLIIMSVLVTGALTWGLWCLAENMLGNLEDHYKAFKYRREYRRDERRISRLSTHDSPLPPPPREEPVEVELPFDEDEAYRERVGINERNRGPGGNIIG